MALSYLSQPEHSSSRSIGIFQHHYPSVAHGYGVERRSKRYQLSCQGLRAFQLPHLDRLPFLAPHLRCSSPSTTMIARASRTPHQHSRSMLSDSPLVLRIVNLSEEMNEPFRKVMTLMVL